MTLKLCPQSIKQEKVLQKTHAENMHQKLVLDPYLILVNKPKQPLHARNSFKIKKF